MRIRTRVARKLLGGAVAAVVAATVAVAGGAAPAQASWYLGSYTGGNGANIRDCYHPSPVWPPSLSCTTVVATVPAWTGLTIVCQVRGQSITGYYGTTDLWNYVVWESGPGRPEGFVADANMNTGYSYWIPGIDVCT